MRSQETVFPDYIYPPPLLDSLGVFHHLKTNSSFFRKYVVDTIDDELSELHVKAPIHSLPCLAGNSLSDVLKLADYVCWSSCNVFHKQSKEEKAITGLVGRFIHEFYYKKQRYEAIRYCPILIYRPAGKKLDDAFSFYLCFYKITLKESLSAPESFSGVHTDADQVDAFHITPLFTVFLPSLRQEDLAAKLTNFNVDLQALRYILRTQVYKLYGLVPSFQYTADGRSHPEDNVQLAWDGGDTTFLVHPNTANWWTLAQNYQYNYLNPQNRFKRPKDQPSFPDRHYHQKSDRFEVNIQNFYAQDGRSFFSEQWKAKLLYFLHSSMDTLEDLLRYQYLDAGRSLPADQEVEAGPFPFLPSSGQWKRAHRSSLVDDDVCSLPPINFPARLLRQNRAEHDLMTRAPFDILDWWLLYTCRYTSRTLFVAAILYAAYAPFFPIRSPKRSSALQTLQALDARRLLVVRDPAALSPESNHPLLSSCDFWQVHHLSSRAAVFPLASVLEKGADKLHIVLCDGPQRALTSRDCDMLLCAAPMVLISNATLPEGYPFIPISVKDLGKPGDAHGFPSPDNLAGLNLVAKHTLARMIWNEAYQKLITANIRSADDFLEGPKASNLPDNIAFLRRMAYNGLHQDQVLRRYKQPAMEMLTALTSPKKAVPYLPFAMALQMLYHANDWMRDTTALFLPYTEKDSPAAAFAQCQKNLTATLPVKHLSAQKCRGLMQQLLPDFVGLLRMWVERDPPYCFHTKEDYLQFTKNGAVALGWESNGMLYLDYNQFWAVACTIKPEYRLLERQKLFFIKNILAPAAGQYLHRDDAKSGHWACRFSVYQNGKRCRIGNFLVLSAEFLNQFPPADSDH